MKQVPRINDRVILRVDHLIYDSGHFDAVLLLELAEVLEAHAVVIILNVVADGLQRCWVSLVHLADESWPTFCHKDCITPCALISLNRRSALLQTASMFSIHDILREGAHFIHWSDRACKVVQLRSHIEHAHRFGDIRWHAR